MTDGRQVTYKQIAYSSDDRVISQTLGNGTFYYEYLAELEADFVNEITVYDRRGIPTRHSIDSNGRRWREIVDEGAASLITEYRFIDNGTVTASEYSFIAKPRGFTTRYEYDQAGNVELIRERVADDFQVSSDDDNLDLITQLSYHDISRFYLPINMFDPRNSETKFFYDFDEGPADLNGDGITNGTAGLLVMMELPPVEVNSVPTTPVWTYQYNQFGQVTQSIDPEESLHNTTTPLVTTVRGVI